MNQLFVYLCGPIDGCADEQCVDWRRQAAEYFGRLCHPIRSLDPILDHGELRKVPQLTERQCLSIISTDLNMINKSAGVLAHFPVIDRVCAGSCMEIFHAAQKGKQVVVSWPHEAAVSVWIRGRASTVHTGAGSLQAAMNDLAIRVRRGAVA